MKIRSSGCLDKIGQNVAWFVPAPYFVLRRTGPGGNGIYVVSIGDSLLVKRVEFAGKGGAIVLISANPAYPPRTIAGDEPEHLKIEGRVVAWYHRF
ncbi:MAG: S24 family peptidase [Spirochaetaceae bacterium]|jgi:phage repressor protein C with HTH and peptisase S24 domain|nr:S24 family peptidase [Spirochaetaceae bacterium]